MSDESVGSPIINVNNVKLHINMTKPLQILRKEFFNLQTNQTKGNTIMHYIQSIFVVGLSIHSLLQSVIKKILVKLILLMCRLYTTYSGKLFGNGLQSCRL